ncbi:60S ribosomal protein [Vigna angularis]|uniref:60S ribosomal protein n=1 Tax=Phaseolus angularis TaxID=3914 RepID=A0A8T0LAI0_PHAAN|nr:60S ribosomal protein [Vigna angularis]
MVKFLRPNKAVIVLQGRYAGRKAVIVRSFDDGTRERPYGHCLVAGIKKYPSKVIKKDSAKKTAKKSRVKAFVKLVNYQHLMPTRYTLDVDLKDAVNPDVLSSKDKKVTALKETKKRFEERFKTGKNRSYEINSGIKMNRVVWLYWGIVVTSSPLFGQMANSEQSMVNVPFYVRVLQNKMIKCNPQKLYAYKKETSLDDTGMHHRGSKRMTFEKKRISVGRTTKHTLLVVNLKVESEATKQYTLTRCCACGETCLLCLWKREGR